MHMNAWQDRGRDQGDARPREEEARRGVQQEPLHLGAIRQRAGDEDGLPVRLHHEAVEAGLDLSAAAGMRMHANAYNMHTNAYECKRMQTDTYECRLMHTRVSIHE